jgi:hypothetical protein
MDDELRTRLDTLEKKLDATFAAADKARKYLFWTGVVTIALVVLPAIGLIFAIPTFLATYTSPDMQSLLQ